MNDTELIQALIRVTGWSQGKTAREIGFDGANITRILQGKQQLSITSRKVVTMLFAQQGYTIGDCRTCGNYEPNIRHCALLDIWFEADGAEQEGECEQYLPDPSNN